MAGTAAKPVYAIVFFDCLRIKVRDAGAVKNKALYLAIGIRCSGHKEVLGMWGSNRPKAPSSGYG